MSFKIGDNVAVTDEQIRGRIISISDGSITINTSDGFDMKFNRTELIKIGVEQSELAKSVNVSFDISDKEESKKNRSTLGFKTKKGEVPAMEVDLHIHKLVKSTRGMDNYDILSRQVDTAQHKLEFAIKKRIPRIVFIHGVGAGVLKTELNFLFNRYNVSVKDASYQKYGLGATEVYIIQNKID
jgi:hypothetical protein